ncbi:KaiC domain-containing protein [Haloprofundus salinisoli]|uniref:KaiC domain-containing protein n=1 Tax=Haloprofundus salinisoli TaxID=2876193 RepID=UPI001CCDA777|nr:KaiC domain-containing protein [Haloprofundus salinisoli]
MSDDDWFERALRDEEGGGDGDDGGDARSEGDESADAKDGESAGRTPDSTDRAANEGNTGRPTASETSAGGDFGFGGVGDDEFEAGGGGGGNGEFGFGSGPGGGGDDDFGFGEFGDAGAGGEEFGFGGGGDDFGGDAEFDSSIERVRIGIDGLDEMILGGVPKRSLMVAIGSAGTGKTTFGLQFLDEALRNDGRAVFITLEQSREAVLATAEEKGWPFRQYVEEDRLAVVELDPIEMANSLASIRNDLPELVEEFGADRLVLDSVSLLEMMYDHPSKRRSEVFEFARSLKEVGVTTMLTSEAKEDSPYTSKHGIVEYLTDAVFVLQYVRPSNFRETRLAIEIQKIRDANHSRETKPYEITQNGISVYRQANIF